MSRNVVKDCSVVRHEDEWLTDRTVAEGRMTLQVSWVRHRDIHLLTIGQYTYTNDQRFRAIHKAQSEDWTLQIKYPQHRDSGIYECQVSTTPHMSHFVHLNVIDPTDHWTLPFIRSHTIEPTKVQRLYFAAGNAVLRILRPLPVVYSCEK
uniref:Ig-like domain-containing protein n=1 Tax=Vespula pensylvanica TaxID=30213 RepID=A0A834PA07_VESPE|nr:hypothetical protein H0235_002379 [Vespula pensylvanica]